jgi:hypothetical protein
LHRITAETALDTQNSTRSAIVRIVRWSSRFAQNHHDISQSPIVGRERGSSLIGPGCELDDPASLHVAPVAGLYDV